MFEGRAESFEAMSDLPKALRAELAAEFQLWTSKVARHLQSADGTEKLLLELADGGQIECVLLRDDDRRTICISTQVGCAMGCVFCASGLDGVDRNLTTGEIVEQMLLLQRLLPAEERLSNIVVMGMGEPLANLDNLLPALDEASADDGLGIGHRRITISTVGLPKQLHRLCELNTRYHLAVSLHAPNDELRNEIVPVNKNIGLAEILAAADRYLRGLRPAADVRVRAARRHQRSAAACAASWLDLLARPDGLAERDSVQPGRRLAVSDALGQCGESVPRHPARRRAST